MPKLNKLTSYSINWLNYLGKTDTEIAKELSISVEQIKKHLEKNNLQNTPANIKTKSSPVKSKSKDLMIRHTRDKKINQVAIMTREASEVNDSMRNKMKSNTTKLNYIFNPNNDKQK